MGQLTTGELEAYGEKPTQCLNDAGMDGAAIKALVKSRLAAWAVTQLYLRAR